MDFLKVIFIFHKRNVKKKKKKLLKMKTAIAYHLLERKNSGNTL